ncbi:Radixin [Schistosoma japonicum]|nr:Radixin [Schistosoma japonicum]
MKWNNPDSKYLKIRVTLHESELEFSISPKSTGKYLFDLVCSAIGLRETWYFGLQFYSFFPNGKMRLSHWLKLDKKIVSQKPEDFSKSLCFFFHTKFFPEDVEQELIQATTRRLFYLSVKSTILNRRDLCPSLDVAILLASLASQAEYGDFCENELSDIEELTYLPRRIFRLIPTQLWTQIQSTQGVTQKFREQYRSHKGMNRDKAELQYLKVAQMHNLFGVDFFPIVYVRMKFPRILSFTRNESTIWHSTNKCHANAWLGVTAAGLQLYGKCQRDPPQFTFPWNLIKNVSYRERKFTIKLTSSFRGTSKSSQVAPIITSMPAGLNDIRGQTVISSKESQPNRSPLIGVTDQGFIGLTVGSSVGGSSTSAASLLSTPISARLVPSNPPVSPNMIDSSVNYPSRGVSKFVSCDPMQQLSIPKSFKGFSKVFDLGSRCIPGLSIKSSCYCANEFAIIDNSVDCLRVSRAQAGENNVALLSKTLPNSNSSTLLISVVEVWLADPNQAKTVMSMCTGNHSLFMRRRQPDSIEVQQMRAQAREERARREVILYPSYLINNIGPVYPEGSYYEVAIKSLWSGIRFVTCETPTTPVGQSISRELQTSLTPFIIFPSCSSALHSNGVLYSNSRIRPINSSYCNHNLWFSTAKSTAYHSSAVCHICLQPQSYMSRVPYAAPSSVSKHPRHSVSDCNVQSIQHNSIDPSQYSYPSSSLDAILSSIVTQRSQLQIPSCSQPICFLSRQQLRSEKLKSSEPVITRSRSHVKMFHSENSGLASSLKSSLMSIHSISHPTNRSFSFKCLHCSTNVCPSYSDLHTGRRYPNETRANSLLNCQYDSATTNEYFRCIKSHDVPTANNDPPWSITLHKLSRTDKCNKDESIYLYESNPLNSQRNLLTNQLQEERAHFTFLWTQFSRQLCNTWAYLKTARGQQFDEPYDFLLHTIGNNVCSNPFHDCELPRYASGPSDGAFTDGVNICNMCDPEACDWHSCLHDTILDHHLYETYSQLNHNVSSEVINTMT